jgi:hypothetical protein
MRNIHELAVDDEVPDVQFQERGYLYLASQQGVEMLLSNHKTQKECGCDWMALLSPEQLVKEFPYVNPEGLAAASFGRKNEGSFDPWALLNAMKKYVRFPKESLAHCDRGVITATDDCCA